MGLAEIQRALANLYTDERLREHFVRDSLSVGRELGLSEDEAQQIAKIPLSQLSFFSNSLVSKRFGEVVKLMPLTQKVLGKSFDNAFRKFAQDFNPNDIKKHLNDAVTFAKYLESNYQKHINGPDWILDLIRFERARLIFSGSGKRILIKRFRFDIRTLIERLDKGEIPEQVEKTRLSGIWWRFTDKGKGKLRWFKF